mmetsp:Transcript_19775/g.50192  ORF Transcript_19775/g.50192 Transcript_19775/m.50192 type:complete len:261 (-) Transcript_19775:1067-1849(-)
MAPIHCSLQPPGGDGCVSCTRHQHAAVRCKGHRRDWRSVRHTHTAHRRLRRGHLLPGCAQVPELHHAIPTARGQQQGRDGAHRGAWRLRDGHPAHLAALVRARQRGHRVGRAQVPHRHVALQARAHKRDLVARQRHALDGGGEPPCGHAFLRAQVPRAERAVVTCGQDVRVVRHDRQVVHRLHVHLHVRRHLAAARVPAPQLSTRTTAGHKVPSVRHRQRGHTTGVRQRVCAWHKPRLLELPAWRRAAARVCADDAVPPA